MNFFLNLQDIWTCNFRKIKVMRTVNSFSQGVNVNSINWTKKIKFHSYKPFWGVKTFCLDFEDKPTSVAFLYMAFLTFSV